MYRVCEVLFSKLHVFCNSNVLIKDEVRKVGKTMLHLEYTFEHIDLKQNLFNVHFCMFSAKDRINMATKL